MPRFSIIVPAYNASATIRETLDALRAQEFHDWECVVVDDGSTDETAAIVRTYVDEDPRFELIRQENRGAAGAYRTGVAEARSELLVICAADDLLLPTHLAVMDEFITRNPLYEIYSCNGEFLDHASGERTLVYSANEWQDERSLSLEDVIGACFFSTGAVFRRGIYAQTGGHRPGAYVDDYDLWMRAMARGARHLYTPAILAVSRVSHFQQSANRARVISADIEAYRHLLKHERLTASETDSVRLAIDRRRRDGAAMALEQQAEGLRRTLERLLGSDRAGTLLDIIHSVSAVTRPARRAVARMGKALRGRPAREPFAPGVRRATRSARADGSESKLKVLIVTPWYPNSGHPHAGVFVAEQACALAGRHDVAVLHAHMGDVAEVPRINYEGGLPVVRTVVRARSGLQGKLGRLAALYLSTRGFQRASLRSARLLARQWGRPDLIHAHVMYPSALAAQVLSRRLHVPYVITEHSAAYSLGTTDWAWAGRLTDRLVRSAVAEAANVIAVSSSQADALVGRGLASAPKVIPNLVPTNVRVTPYPDRRPHRIAHMSLMREQHKNISMLVRAVAKLWGTRQDFELVLAGDGPDREVLEQRVREAGLLDSAIRFVGAVPTNAVAEFYAGACFSVVSSVVETFCMAAAESIASGRPVVSTRCGGPEDFISDEVGRLVANDDAEEMAVALDWMLDHYTDFQPARVHEHAASLFTADRVVRQLDAVYCAVLHRRQGAC